MVKGFSTVRDTQRGSQSYMKKRRGRKEIELSRRRKRGNQRKEIELSRRRKRGNQEKRDRSRLYSVP